VTNKNKATHTAKIFFERLYLILEHAPICALSQLSVCSHTPTVYSEIWWSRLVDGKEPVCPFAGTFVMIVGALVTWAIYT